jgi:hypothetical protein
MYRKHKVSGQAFVEFNARQRDLCPWRSKVSKLDYHRLVMEVAGI